MELMVSVPIKKEKKPIEFLRERETRTKESQTSFKIAFFMAISFQTMTSFPVSSLKEKEKREKMKGISIQN